jgi:hypothetical protein
MAQIVQAAMQQVANELQASGLPIPFDLATWHQEAVTILAPFGSPILGADGFEEEEEEETPDIIIPDLLAGRSTLEHAIGQAAIDSMVPNEAANAHGTHFVFSPSGSKLSIKSLIRLYLNDKAPPSSSDRTIRVAEGSRFHRSASEKQDRRFLSLDARSPLEVGFGSRVAFVAKTKSGPTLAIGSLIDFKTGSDYSPSMALETAQTSNAVARVYLLQLAPQYNSSLVSDGLISAEGIFWCWFGKLELSPSQKEVALPSAALVFLTDPDAPFYSHQDLLALTSLCLTRAKPVAAQLPQVADTPTFPYRWIDGTMLFLIDQTHENDPAFSLFIACPHCPASIPPKEMPHHITSHFLAHLFPDPALVGIPAAQVVEHSSHPVR